MENIYKPGECMKHMTVEMHPVLSSAWYCADVSREVAASGARAVAAPDLCDPALVLWARAAPPVLATSGGQVHLRPKQSCANALYVLPADEVAQHVARRALTPHVARVQDLVQKELTLVVFGVKDHFKSSKRKTQNSNRAVMTEIEFEMAMTDLLVSAECATVTANTPNELALLIVQFTKAIAEAPYKEAKRALDEQAEFYMRGDNKKCVAVDKAGLGVTRLWQQMLAVLPHSSLEIARSLCAEHKTPRALYEALRAPNGVNELADLGVARAAVPGAAARRLGPEFARKLSALLTAVDGDVVLE